MSNLESRMITIEKTFNASLKVVWDAWTQSEQIVKWWAPNGMDVKVEEHDFSIGGKWRYTMMMPNGSEFISQGVYKEIIEQERIVTLADFKPMTENVELIASFEAVGELTKFTFKVIHPTEEYRIQQEKMGIYNGWGSAFERLRVFVETL